MDESYQYIVVPGINSDDIARYAKNLPLTVLSNTVKIQSVSHDHLEITGIVFHQAGEFVVGNDLTVSVNSPYMLLIIKGMITLRDPTATLKEIKITLNKGEGIVQTKRIELPSGGFDGKSVSVKMDL